MSLQNLRIGIRLDQSLVSAPPASHAAAGGERSGIQATKPAIGNTRVLPSAFARQPALAGASDSGEWSEF